MYLRRSIKRDLDKIENMLRKIHIDAVKLFKESQNINSKTKNYTYIYKDESNYGIFSTLEAKEFTVSYVSFENDLKHDDVLKEIHTYLKDIIKKRGKKDLYLNIYQNNESIINYFRNYGFKKDTTGFEFRYSSSKPISFLMPLNIKIRGYEEEKLNKYINVFDNAFNSLNLQENQEIDYYKNHRDSAKKMFLSSDKRGDFAAFWKNDNLLGISIIKDEYIQYIAVDREFQNKAYGTLILNYCLDKLINERKKSQVILKALACNSGAHRFYLRNGFQITGEYAEHTYKPAS